LKEREKELMLEISVLQKSIAELDAVCILVFVISCFCVSSNIDLFQEMCTSNKRSAARKHKINRNATKISSSRNGTISSKEV